MRVQTEEWRRFIPGVRMYKGKKTLFYNGEILWKGRSILHGRESVLSGRHFIYDKRERDSWEVIIVLPEVKTIPECTFKGCEKVKTVIMSDTVIRIESGAFYCCYRLSFVKLSRNLEYIGWWAFYGCKCLLSIFIPPSCRVISCMAFDGCDDLIIAQVPPHTEFILRATCTTHAPPFPTQKLSRYSDPLKFINYDGEDSLHRLCCSTYEDETFPIQEQIYKAMKEHGPQVLQKENEIGITPLQYLAWNPYLNIDEMKMLKIYVKEKMGRDNTEVANMELLRQAQNRHRVNVKSEQNDNEIDEIVPTEILSSTDVPNTSNDVRNEKEMIPEKSLDGQHYSKRLKTLKTAVSIKREDIVDGVVKCPVCQMAIVTGNKGCNIITCRNHSPQFVYFCIHCKKVNENGVDYVTCPCESRNTRETRAMAQKRRNEEAKANPIEIE